MEVPVAESSHLVLASGPYRILALSQARDADPETAASYAVATADGAILRRDLTLYEAQAWLDRLLEGDATPLPPVPARRRPPHR